MFTSTELKTDFIPKGFRIDARKASHSFYDREPIEYLKPRL